MIADVTMPLTSRTVETLAHIRLLHAQGVELAGQPEPLSAPAVLSFHDGVEMFYVLACEHLGIQISPKADFNEYWRKIAERVPSLVQRRGMERLNRIRVDYKHHVQIPGARNVNQARVDVDEFFLGNTPLIFGVDYSSVSMADVVPQADTRKRLNGAIAADRDGKRTEAMGLLLLAFHELFDPHQRPASRVFGQQGPIRPFELGGKVDWPLSPGDLERVLSDLSDQSRRSPVRGGERLASQINQVTKVATATQTAVRMIALGIDFYRFARFEALTPIYIPTFGNPDGWRAPDNYAPNDEELQYCLQFVVDVALRLAVIEGHLAAPSWVGTAEVRPG
ncbi:hypothetical protein AB0B69_28465 [Micromonospora parva]|uniref:hypothetical protein n=1 Tax=Micromonospora parva TaxID=1464048 RepID=UPI0033EC47F3